MAARNRNVFINCPFDTGYQRFFNAIIFTVLRFGFRPRCALETDDASQNRFEKICSIIMKCRYGIHDISRTEIGPCDSFAALQHAARTWSVSWREAVW